MDKINLVGGLKCLCGNLLGKDSKNQGKLFKKQINQGDEKSGDNEVYFEGKGRWILECEKCGALAIQDHHLYSTYSKFYLPYNKKFNGLLKYN